jgi:hypothetical protein
VIGERGNRHEAAMPRSLRPSLQVVALLALCLPACRSGAGNHGGNLGSGATGGSIAVTGGAGASAGSGASGAEPSMGGSGIGVGGAITTGGAGTAGAGGTGATAGACQTAQAEATLEREPVDIIVVLDNSGSMAEEMGAAEENINVNFANILDQAQADYRVILLSRHRQGPRDEEEEFSTSICVSTPLSGLASCPSENPTFSDRFFQWGGKIESFDALDWMIDAYDTPPEDDDAADLAPNGYGEWLRPGAKKVFVVMTDDDESNDDEGTPLGVEAFLAGLTAKDAAAFGTATAPTFDFHSIIGVKEKADPTAAYDATEPLVEEECTGNGADIEATGVTYQELSILTDGLRFPLCQFPGYDAVFRTIAENVIVKRNIACEFDIPPPPSGTELDLDKVAVRKTAQNGTESRFMQALTAEDCQADAFYIDRTEGQVHLCPEACEAVRADPQASVDVLFTCMSTLIVKQADF